MITLKRIVRAVHPYEVDIALYFSSEDLALQPANHCVPVHDVLALDDDDDFVIIVLPLLRPYGNPRFDTIGEAVECFRQLFEVMLSFATDACIKSLPGTSVHAQASRCPPVRGTIVDLSSVDTLDRDCMNKNIMLDPSHLYPQLFNPLETDMNKDCSGPAKHFTRTQKPPRYYFIDFGISRRYDPSVANPREVPIWGGDKEVPEFQNSDEPCDPFATDIFYIGNAINMDFLLVSRQLCQPCGEFFLGLMHNSLGKARLWVHGTLSCRYDSG